MRLTTAETLFIVRRRRGRSQSEHAAALGLTTSRYVRMEKGQIAGTSRASLYTSVGKLKPNERCVIMRRRCGYTQQRVADELGMSRYWVRLMEKGEAPVDDLLWYWEQ